MFFPWDNLLTGGEWRQKKEGDGLIWEGEGAPPLLDFLSLYPLLSTYRSHFIKKGESVRFFFYRERMSEVSVYSGLSYSQKVENLSALNPAYDTLSDLKGDLLAWLPEYDSQKGALRRALFLDRDGVINEDYGYVGKWSDFKFIETIWPIFSLAELLDLPIMVITNQSGVARGFFSLEDVNTLHSKITEKILARHPRLDLHWYVSPYHASVDFPEGPYNRHSLTRKPGPGLYLRAAREHHLSLGNSLMVGDKTSDACDSLYLPAAIQKKRESIPINTPLQRANLQDNHSWTHHNELLEIIKSYFGQE